MLTVAFAAAVYLGLFLGLNRVSSRCPVARYQLGLALLIVVGVALVAVATTYSLRGHVYVVDLR